MHIWWGGVGRALLWLWESVPGGLHGGAPAVSRLPWRQDTATMEGGGVEVWQVVGSRVHEPTALLPYSSWPQGCGDISSAAAGFCHHGGGGGRILRHRRHPPPRSSVRATLSAVLAAANETHLQTASAISPILPPLAFQCPTVRTTNACAPHVSVVC